MKKYFKYFVVDTLTESIVGSFEAINNDVAYKILDESIKNNEKLKLIGDNLELCYVSPGCDVPETFDEVKEVCISAHWTIVEPSKEFAKEIKNEN